MKTTAPIEETCIVMNGRWFHCVWFCVACCVGPAALHAAEADRVWTILFCVSRFDDPALIAPPKAAARAAQLSALLKDPAFFPGSAGRLFLLADPSIPDAVSPTADHLREAFDRISRQAKPQDLLLIIVVTSGAPTREEFRWFGADADSKHWPRTSFLSSEIKDLIDATRCSRVLSIVDACFNLSSDALSGQRGMADDAWAFAFAGLQGPGRVVLASTDGHVADAQDWLRKSDDFFSRVVGGLKGAADRDGGEADGWISAEELLAYVQDGDKSAWTAGSARNAWIARNKPAADEADRRIGVLRARCNQRILEPPTCSTGVRLLSRMPRFDDDRELRLAFTDYIDGKRSVDELEAKRRRTLTRRNLPEPEAIAFAAKLQEAWSVIADGHLDADRAPVALEAGLLAAADEMGEALTDAARDEINRIVRLKPPELATELSKFRLRLGRRDAVPDSLATDVALTAMMASLDPYSAYLSPNAYRDMRDHAAGKFTGIGALLREDPIHKSIVVLAPIRGGPSERAGLLPDDRIIAVDGQAVADIGAETASNRLLGPEGSTVKVLVERPDASRVDIAVQRQTVPMDNIVGWERRPDGGWDYTIDKVNRIAYLRITNFASDTPAVLRRLLLELERDGMWALVLDLRFNPGGLLDSAVAVCDLFLTEGPIVRVKGRKSRDRTFAAHKFGSFDDVKLCVLVNGSSASGSEILAAAIQDNHRGAIVGSRTFGKASVQDIVPMSDEKSALKVTSARFYRPDGANLERYLGGRLSIDDAWGVRPDRDLEVSIDREGTAILRADLFRRQVLDASGPPKEIDPQLTRALQYLKDATNANRNSTNP